jgi:hypothetical protein
LIWTGGPDPLLAIESGGSDAARPPRPGELRLTGSKRVRQDSNRHTPPFL